MTEQLNSNHHHNLAQTFSDGKKWQELSSSFSSEKTKVLRLSHIKDLHPRTQEFLAPLLSYLELLATQTKEAGHSVISLQLLFYHRTAEFPLFQTWCGGDSCGILPPVQDFDKKTDVNLRYCHSKGALGSVLNDKAGMGPGPERGRIAFLRPSHSLCFEKEKPLNLFPTEKGKMGCRLFLACFQ